MLFCWNCYLAVDDEVADASGEVFVLELGVDVGHVLIHSSQLQHLRPIQMPVHRSELRLPLSGLMSCSLSGHYRSGKDGSVKLGCYPEPGYMY